MRGLLITNGFVKEANFLALRDALCAAAEARGISLVPRTNDALLFDAASCTPLFDAAGYDFAILWDKDKYLGMQLEAMGLRVFNSVRALSLCDDKALTHIALARHGIPMPRTILVPRTYPFVGYGSMEFLDHAIALLGLPLILKECSGSFGKQVYLANTRAEAAELLAAREGTPMLMQEFVRTSLGRDVRAYVVGGRVVAAMERRNETDFRANVARGGSCAPYALSPEEEALSKRAAALLGLDYAGVDLLHGADGPLVCEVNSNAHFQGLAACTGVDIAGAILAHIASAVMNPRFQAQT